MAAKGGARGWRWTSCLLPGASGETPGHYDPGAQAARSPALTGGGAEVRTGGQNRRATGALPSALSRSQSIETGTRVRQRPTLPSLVLQGKSISRKRKNRFQQGGVMSAKTSAFVA